MKCIYYVEKEESDWNKLFSIFRYTLDDNIFIEEYSTNVSIDNTVDYIFIPLVRGKIENYLTRIKRIRRDGVYKTIVVFFAANSFVVPDIFHPEKPCIDDIKNILGKPKAGYPQEFEDVQKPIVYAEIIYKITDNKKTILNIINLSSFDIMKLKDTLLTIKKYEISEKVKKLFYKTFIYYYDNLNVNAIEFTINENQKDFFQECFLSRLDFKFAYKILGIILTNKYEYLKCLFDWADRAYTTLNDSKESTHKVQYEMFRAPIPFPLYELYETKLDVEKTTNIKIKLLLIDNKIDKFIDSKEVTASHLTKLLSSNSYYINNLFEIKMLGDVIFKNNDFKNVDKDKKLTTRNDFIDEVEKFNFKCFKDAFKELIDPSNVQKQNNYALKVYNEITSHHFILLDFFLNKENTYLAYDFIKDISEIQKLKGDYSTIWYFITSAIYDSVVKYSQSGLLAEYYELAVVNAGDDPTNEKRQIIFVYKLLTFINARIKTFKRYKEAIENMMLNEVSVNKNALCCVFDKKRDYKSQYIRTTACFEECAKVKCLEKLKIYIKRYQTEYDNIWSLFYEKKHKEDYKDIAELLNDTITKFIWLPEADWRLIQHQIDFINTKLKSITKDIERGTYKQFSCNFIIDEVRRRSEIY